MMDVDYFKNINDQYGHDAGDLVCRYGGEEFLIILYDIEENKALEVLLTEIRQMEVFHMGNTINSVTASFGMVTFPKDGNNATDLMHLADKALYQSKKTGRNKITVFKNYLNQ